MLGAHVNPRARFLRDVFGSDEEARARAEERAREASGTDTPLAA